MNKLVTCCSLIYNSYGFCHKFSMYNVFVWNHAPESSICFLPLCTTFTYSSLSRIVGTPRPTLQKKDGFAILPSAPFNFFLAYSWNSHILEIPSYGSTVPSKLCNYLEAAEYQLLSIIYLSTTTSFSELHLFPIFGTFKHFL